MSLKKHLVSMGPSIYVALLLVDTKVMDLFPPFYKLQKKKV